MNLPWYGWSRWTCFVRSRSGSAASDHERSRSRVAYSSSWVTGTHGSSAPVSEGLRKPLHAALADGDHVEADGEAPELRARREPGLRGAAQPAALFRGHHLEWVA